VSLESRLGELTGGQAVEAAILNWLDDGTRTVRGRFRGSLGGQLVIEVAGQNKRWPLERVRYVSALDEMLHCASFTEGDKVRFTKYGSTYAGTVARVMKTRLEVRFQTVGDERAGRAGRLTTISAIDVERIERTVNY
jgi:hypothetical protein